MPPLRPPRGRHFSVEFLKNIPTMTLQLEIENSICNLVRSSLHQILVRGSANGPQPDGCAMEGFGKNEKGNGKEPDTGHSSGQKRRNPDGLRDDADEEPSTRPCLHLENGSEHGSSVPSGISTSATMSRALRRLPAGQIRETIIVRSEAHACTILNGLQQIYQDESLCDVTLRVDGEDFRAHRVVLAASSDFLRSVHAPMCTLHLLAQATCMTAI